MDRNAAASVLPAGVPSSPPARVAWIETFLLAILRARLWVATREGGVDRNMNYYEINEDTARSPPARVAWIET